MLDVTPMEARSTYRRAVVPDWQPAVGTAELLARARSGAAPEPVGEEAARDDTPPEEVGEMLTKNTARVLEALRQNPGASAVDLAPPLKLSTKTAANALQRLARKGLAARTGRGEWRAVGEDGKAEPDTPSPAIKWDGPLLDGPLPDGPPAIEPVPAAVTAETSAPADDDPVADYGRRLEALGRALQSPEVPLRTLAGMAHDVGLRLRVQIVPDHDEAPA